MDAERSKPAEFNGLRAKAFTLAQSVLGYIRNKYAADDVDCGKSGFTSELVTRKPCSWSGHGPKHDGTFALPLDGDHDVVNLADLLDAASGGHSLDNTLAHLRLVLHLLLKQ